MLRLPELLICKVNLTSSVTTWYMHGHALKSIHREQRSRHSQWHHSQWDSLSSWSRSKPPGCLDGQTTDTLQNQREGKFGTTLCPCSSVMLLAQKRSLLLLVFTDCWIYLSHWSVCCLKVKYWCRFISYNWALSSESSMRYKHNATHYMMALYHLLAY